MSQHRVRWHRYYCGTELYNKVCTVQYSIQSIIQNAEYNTVYRIKYSVQNTIQCTEYNTVYRIQSSVQNTIQCTEYMQQVSWPAFPALGVQRMGPLGQVGNTLLYSTVLYCTLRVLYSIVLYSTLL